MYALHHYGNVPGVGALFLLTTMQSEFPRLEYVVLDAHEVAIDFALFSADFGDGYQTSALVGSPHGLKSWQITYGHLKRTPHRAKGRFSQEATADYLWDFFMQRMREGNSPFIVRCPRDGKDYLASFTETKLGYKEAFKNRFYTTGIAITQRRVRGVISNEDGSLGVS